MDMEAIRAFQNVIDDPGKYLEGLSARKKIIGYCCTYTPEEIIHAAGLHPFRLFGGTGDTGIADKHLQSYCCSLVRGVLADVLNGRLDALSGAVFPHTCDTMQRLSDIWRMNTSFPFFADVVFPVKLNTESAREYFEEVLRKFRADLEKGFGTVITDESLRNSIKLTNIIRSSLKKIYQAHADNPALITGSDLNKVAMTAMILERETAASMLADLADEIAKGPVSSGPKRRRVMLVGSLCAQPDIYSILEKAGADAVWDDLCTGSRYFEGPIREDGDPIKAIADRYYGRMVCPAKHSSVTARGENLVRLVDEHSIEGVIFLMLKFCDPHAFDYPYLKAFLDEKKVPSMLLEIEGQLPPEGGLLTRFETFVQML
jgi:benzoyl-CoA reductase subunit C